MKLRKMSLKIFWTLFIVFVFLLALSCYFKFYFKNIYVEKNNLDAIIFNFEDTDSDLPLQLKPNTSIIFEGESYRLKPTNITINSQGFRDYEYNIKKPKDTVRILSFGDSIAFGWGIELNDTYAKVLERKLKVRSDKKYQVLNFGVFGYNTKEQIILLEKKGLGYEPDIVLMTFLANDIDFSYYVFNEGVFLGHIGKKLENSRFRDSALIKWINWKLYSNMIKELNNEVSIKTKWQNFEREFNKLSNLSKQYNFSVVILLISLPNIKDMSRFENTIEKNDFYLIDMQYDYKSNNSLVVNKYDKHPNAKMNKIYAEGIYDFLIKNNLV